MSARGPSTVSSELVSAQDWGLLYGYGLFETLCAYRGVLVFLEEHVDRMLASAFALGFENTPPREQIINQARAFAHDFGRRVVRITLTAGNTDAGVAPALVLAQRAVPYTAAQRANGVVVRIAPGVRDERSTLVCHKTLNQLQNVLAWREGERLGYQESLFLNTLGCLAEGSRSNVFVVKEGAVSTPPVQSGILPGITRRKIMELLREEGIAVRESAITKDELFACDECFLTNSVMEVMRVAQIGQQRLPSSVPGNVTAVAATAYTRIVQAAVVSCGVRESALQC